MSEFLPGEILTGCDELPGVGEVAMGQDRITVKRNLICIKQKWEMKEFSISLISAR
jgi:hypothetical protein